MTRSGKSRRKWATTSAGERSCPPSSNAASLQAQRKTASKNILQNNLLVAPQSLSSDKPFNQTSKEVTTSFFKEAESKAKGEGRAWGQGVWRVSRGQDQTSLSQIGGTNSLWLLMAFRGYRAWQPLRIRLRVLCCSMSPWCAVHEGNHCLWLWRARGTQRENIPENFSCRS